MKYLSKFKGDGRWWRSWNLMLFFKNNQWQFSYLFMLPNQSIFVVISLSLYCLSYCYSFDIFFCYWNFVCLSNLKVSHNKKRQDIRKYGKNFFFHPLNIEDAAKRKCYFMKVFSELIGTFVMLLYFTSEDIQFNSPTFNNNLTKMLWKQHLDDDEFRFSWNSTDLTSGQHIILLICEFVHECHFWILIVIKSNIPI